MHRLLFSAAILSTSTLLLVDATVKGAVILLLASAAVLLLRRDSAATRHLVWLTAIGAILVVPLCSVLLPQWRVLPSWLAVTSDPNTTESVAAVSNAAAEEFPVVSVPSIVTVPTERRAAEAAPASSNQPVFETDVPGPVSELPANRPSADTAQADVSSAQPSEADSWIYSRSPPLLWAGGFLLLALRLAAARWMLGRNERRATVVAAAKKSEGVVAAQNAPQSVVEAFEFACQQLGIQQPVTLLTDGERTMPVVWGIFRYRLMLPASAVQWAPT